MSIDQHTIEGFFSDLLDGKDLYGVPIWGILVAILIIIVVILIVSKKRNRIDTEYASPSDLPLSQKNVVTGANNIASEAGHAPSSQLSEQLPSEPPALPVVQQYAKDFDLGNGLAVCRTLPAYNERIVAKLKFGEDIRRGIFPIGESMKSIRIGRGTDNDLSLNNDSVSRHHIKIRNIGKGEFTISDLDSGNRLFVNDNEVIESNLFAGDRVELGEVSFVFLLEEE